MQRDMPGAVQQHGQGKQCRGAGGQTGQPQAAGGLTGQIIEQWIDQECEKPAQYAEPARWTGSRAQTEPLPYRALPDQQPPLQYEQAGVKRCGKIDAGHTELRLSVILSARQLQHDGLVDDVRAILKALDLAAEALDFELTESLLMDDATRSLKLTQALRGLGVGISIDDFGTGYSSLSYLKKFPIQTLEIARSFVRDIVTDADDAAIVKAILSLADRLKLQVVAEGVESLAQHEFLRREGCRQVQGRRYARPLDSDRALQYLGADDRNLYAVS